MFICDILWGSLATSTFGNSSVAANNTQYRLLYILSLLFLWLWYQGGEQPEIGGDTDEKLLCDKPPLIYGGTNLQPGAQQNVPCQKYVIKMSYMILNNVFSIINPCTNRMYELPHELLNDLRRRILQNKEILRLFTWVFLDEMILELLDLNSQLVDLNSWLVVLNS